MPTPDKFFISHEGDLVRKSDCSTFRPYFMRHFPVIKTTSHLKATIREGRNTNCGPINFVMDDGGVCCFNCVKFEIRLVLGSMRSKAKDGWSVVGCEVNLEDDNLYCAHCNKKLPAAYGEQW